MVEGVWSERRSGLEEAVRQDYGRRTDALGDVDLCDVVECI
jgi:hypothetical protein